MTDIIHIIMVVWMVLVLVQQAECFHLQCGDLDGIQENTSYFLHRHRHGVDIDR